MDRLWSQMKKPFQKVRPPPSKVNLVDRSTCPAFLSLRKLTDDPDLHRHVTIHASQLMHDLKLPTPSARGGDVCRCPDRADREKNALKLGRKIAANKEGWQDALAQALVGYIVSHLSAGIVADGGPGGAVHRAIADAARTTEWVGLCPNHMSRSSPAGVVGAVCRSIGARLAGADEAVRGSLRRCAVMGALLDVVAGCIWRACDGFRGDVDFREHAWRRDEVVVGAFEVYLRDPSREAFEVAVGDLEMGLSGRRLCVCGKH